jgi:hypothetical protein
LLLFKFGSGKIRAGPGGERTEVNKGNEGLKVFNYHAVDLCGSRILLAAAPLNAAWLSI